MAVYPIQATFARGELSPKLHARADIEHWKMGLAVAMNFIVTRQGGLRRRPGTEFMGMGKAAPANKARFIPFTFSRTQSYVIELAAGKMRFFSVYGQVLVGGVPYELDMPYQADDLAAIHFAQSGDALHLFHTNYRTLILKRFGETDWRLEIAPFVDGPWLRIAEGFTAIKPTGTGNAAAGGTVSASSDDGTNPPINAFDGNEATFWKAGGTGSEWLNIEFPAPRVLTSYAITSSDDTTPDPGDINAGRMGLFSSPRTWSFEGLDGTGNWVILDQQTGQVGWGPKEVRAYSFANKTAYGQYRLVVATRNDSVDLRESVRITDFSLGGAGNDSGLVTLAANNVTEINDGAGFQAADVGRQIRLFATDALWHWMEILSVEGPQNVTCACRGTPLPNDKSTAIWRLGAFGEIPGYPASGAFYNQRLVCGRTEKQPQTLLMSKTADYYNFGTSTPSLATDGISFTIAELGEIAFFVESQELMIGTATAARTMGSSDKNAGFSATNFNHVMQDDSGFYPLQPVLAGDTALCVNVYRQSVLEFRFTPEEGKYRAKNISVLSDHIFSPGIREVTYAKNPNALVWVLLDNGTLATITYEQEQAMVGMTRHVLGGGGRVETMCTIPGIGRDETWFRVRRTINGADVVTVERVTIDFEEQEAADQIFLDCSERYVGAPASTISGLDHLVGGDLQVLADAAPIHRLRDGTTIDSLVDGKQWGNVPTTLTLAVPSITLEVPASKVTVGYPYVSAMQTLRVASGQSGDGTALGRKVRCGPVIVDLLRSQGLMARANAGEFTDLILRENEDRMDYALPLFTGTTTELYLEDTWQGSGQLFLATCAPLSVTIRAVVGAYQTEP